MKRRAFLRLAAVAGVVPFGASLAHAAGSGNVLRIGYQKSSAGLILTKESGGLERRLHELGFGLAWYEFAAGPQMMEALNAGSIDLAMTGDTPPIFAQAAGARLVYAGHEPAKPDSSAILVLKDSSLGSVADLRGKRIAFQKGSSAHNLVLKALVRAGVRPAEVTFANLTPAEGRAAFERGSVDAWGIWDPFYAQAEQAVAVRALATGRGLASNYTFYLASQSFAENHSQVLQTVFAELARNQQWRERAPDEVATVLARYADLDKSIFDVVLKRRPDFSVRPLTPEVVAEQQEIADLFLQAGVIPKSIRVSEVVWRG